MIAKAGLGLIGLSAISVGGVALAKPSWLGMGGIPSFKTLTEAKKTGLESKWGNDYKSFFVEENSDDWFEWAYEERYKKNKSASKSKFQGLTVGKGKDATNSLAKACKEAYETTTASVTTTADDATGDKFFEDNIWTYCSVGGKKLKTINTGSDNNSYPNGLGNTHSSELLSATETDNDWAWHIKQKEFLNGAEPAEGVFKKFYKDNQEHKNEKNGTKLREECKDKYSKAATSGEGADNETTLKADALKKYCSLKTPNN